MTRPTDPAEPTPADQPVGTGEEALADAGLPQDPAGDETAPPSAPRAGRGGLAHRLYNGEAGLDVVGRSRLIYKITAIVVLLCVVTIVFRGFNFGIDFEGGNSFRLPGSQEQLADARAAAEDAGAQVATAQIVGGDTLLIRTEQLDNEAERAVVESLADAVGIEPAQVSPESVSADWGQDITDQALVALAVFLVAVVLFLAVRFQPKMAVGAMAALAHDIVITAGVYSLIGFEVTPSTVIGFLTILGFSLYDTVVVFDKVDENTRDLGTSARMTWGEAANLAVNQTLMRSINTSVIALLPVAGLLFVGAGLLGVGTLKDLALVLFVGLAAGTYSSIVLATPIVADLKEREPEVQALRRRVLARRSSAARTGGAAAPSGPVASARRRRPSGGVAVADLPRSVPADVVVESPASVRPDGPRGASAAPRPGARPQRPGTGRPSGKRRR
ncbi:protein translocase subunit SecF [Blastococcus sp. MG754426]|uniref:protein translocase subunit SecF n=1 Tax=unclassified Blastococcus TaxID=2619396 RepID=UPI001EF0C8DB|nr:MULTISPECIES: protein translocase subunit SecF [unclassified Blastococcus]MCF6507547.1 protein translocase subunit SecF [Blastococcus sp. MG754426]MCF6512069.1 protein translocase subunit SecF [Blastococcus sp. MG754427]